MNRKTQFVTAGLAAAVLAAMPTVAPKAQSAAEFYSGKTLKIFVGVSPGGIYGTFALMLSRYMGQHMAGKPKIVIQIMRGAGGTKAMNYIYNVAAQDGSVAIAPNAGIAKRVLLRIGNPKYDPAKLQWLGGWGEAVNTITLRSDGPVKTLKEAMQKVAVLGAIGRSSNTFMIPSLMNNTIGTKFKIITGYKGGSPIRNAIEKGELHGWSGQWLGWKMRKADWIRDGKIVNLVQMASKRAPDLQDIPLLAEFALNDEQREFFSFVQTGIADRAFVVAPGVPKNRAAALSRAYMATLRDKIFIAEVGKRHYVLDPIEGPRIQKFVESIMKLPPAKVERLRTLMGLTKKK